MLCQSSCPHPLYSSGQQFMEFQIFQENKKFSPLHNNCREGIIGGVLPAVGQRDILYQHKGILYWLIWFIDPYTCVFYWFYYNSLRCEVPNINIQNNYIYENGKKGTMIFPICVKTVKRYGNLIFCIFCRKENIWFS